MAKKQEALQAENKASRQVVKTARSNSGTNPPSGAGRATSVTPTSERIIKATSVKRRTAMKVLANR